MADDITITSGANSTPPDGTVVATDDVGGKHYQKVKIALGAENAIDTLVDSGQQTMTNSVPMVLASDHSDVKVTLDGETVPVSDGSGSLTVDAVDLDIRNLTKASDSVAAWTNTAKDGSGTAYQPLVDADGHLQVDVLSGGGGGTQYTEADTDASITGTAILWEDTSDTLRAVSAAKPLPVGDGGGSLTVDGTVTVQDGGSSITVDSGGTFAVQDSQVIADDAAFTVATSKVFAAGFLADEASTDSVDEGDAGAARMTLDRRQIVVPQPHASGGCSIFRSLDLDESEEEVKGTAGCVYGWFITNTATSTRWVKFYNATAANVTVGSTTPVMTLGIPGNSSDDVGANLLGGVGIAFDTAITVAATTAVADADTGAPAANDVVINLFYK